MDGGIVAVKAGAKVVQVGYNILQQTNSGLLAICALQKVGTLIQSSLCQVEFRNPTF